MKSAWVILIFVAVAVLSAVLPDLMLSPGSLTQGHQDIKNNCTYCHRPFGGIETSRCTRCHRLTTSTNDTTATEAAWKNKDLLSFHRQLKERECLACHTDHKGRDPKLATQEFDHDLLPAGMKTSCDGCHGQPNDKLHGQVSASCYSCHNTESWKLEGVFNHDLIVGIRKTACSSCHPVPEDALHQSLNENCDQCHNTTRWVPATFDHATYFVLDRDHNVKCNTCHTNKDYKAYTCYSCHEHSEANIREEHEEHGIYRFSDCASCHRSADEDDIREYDRRGRSAQDINKVKEYMKNQREDED